jgi:hypothetical protein
MTKTTLSLAIATVASALLFANLAWAEAVLTQVSGTVEVGRGEPAAWSPAKMGDVVAANDRVRTGADGRVEIRTDAGTLRVHENSMLRLPPATAEADRVELEQGRSLFDVLRRDGRRLEVHTPTVVVSVKGTRFGVYAGVEVGKVTVYRGTVGVREVGAVDMMETLVREGFLATGGVGIPVELDVSSASDPWQSWQQFDRAQQEEFRAPKRMGEMDRAKATLHRATAADVIVKAAERRPEIAERLKQLQEKQHKQDLRNPENTDDPTTGKTGPMPASPDFGDETSATIKRQILKQRLDNEARTMRVEDMRAQALEAQQVIDATRGEQELSIEESTPTETLCCVNAQTNANYSFDFAAVYKLSPMALMLVQESIKDLQSQFLAGSFAPTSPTDLLTELELDLVSKGMTTGEASTTVQTLIGN